LTQDISNRMQEAAVESELSVSSKIRVRGLSPKARWRDSNLVDKSEGLREGFSSTF